MRYLVWSKVSDPNTLLCKSSTKRWATNINISDEIRKEFAAGENLSLWF